MTDKTYVPAEGPPDAKYILVAEAPGAVEEQKGRTLIGPSGTLMRYSLDRIGIPENEVYFTNVCKYRPPNNDINKWAPKSKKLGRKPNELVQAGMAELIRDIAEIRRQGGAKVIIPVGNVALWALTGLQEIAKRRGSIWPVDIDLERIRLAGQYYNNSDQLAEDIYECIKCKVVPTLHPASILRQYNMKPIFEMDLKKAKRETGYPEIRRPVRDITVDPDKSTAYSLVDRLAEYDRFAFDIETPGGGLYCIGFSADPSWGFVLRTDEAWKFELIEMLLSSERRKIAHNGLFDTGYLKYHLGIDVPGYDFDTMYAQKLLYAEWRQGLDFSTSFYTDEPYYKDEGKDQDLNIADDAYTYMKYCGKDACNTMEIALAMERLEMRHQHRRACVENHMQLLPIARDMMVKGIRIDMKKLKEIHDQTLLDWIETAKLLDEIIFEHLVEYLDKTKDVATAALVQDLAMRMKTSMEKEEVAFNVMSNPDVKLYLYKVRGFKEKRHKHTKAVTAEETALKELYGETGDIVLLHIVKSRQKRKLLSSYLSPRIAYNGRLMYSVNICGTKTQRWSSGQTIIVKPAKADRKKKGDKVGANAQTIPGIVRLALVADRGYVLFYADLSAVEDRIVAYAGGVQRKIHAFEHNIDAHALTASGFFGSSVEDVLAEAKAMKLLGKTPPKRYIGKQSNHAYNYGEGWMTFMRNMNKKADETGIRINAEQSKRIRINHFRMYPEIESVYWEWIKDQLRNHGSKLKNPFGYERTFYGRHDEATFRDAYSWYPQSTAPEIINRGMVRIHKSLPEVEILLHVHDAILGQVPEKDVDSLRAPIIQLMDEPLYIRDKEIHVPVDIKFGERWGELG